MTEGKKSELENIAILALPLFVYISILVAVRLNLLSYELYHFYSFAIVFGIISLFVLKDRNGERKLNLGYLIVIPLLIAIAIRAIPYTDNSVPLGYDPGFYKYEIERYWKGLPELIPSDLENWDRQWSPPGLFIITSILHLYGFDSFDQYNFLFIFFDVIVVLAVYSAGKRFFSQEAGIIAALFYSVSLVQFAAFYLFYFKNVVSVFLALIAFYFLKSKKYLPLVITGAMVGAIHRPTFLIFGLAYLLSFIGDLIKPSERSDIVRKFTSGFLVLLLAIAFYIPAHLSALTPLKSVIESVGEEVQKTVEVSPKERIPQQRVGPGNFIPVEDFIYSSMYYLPLAVSGILIAVRRRNLNPILLWAIATSIIVYFQLFFYSRFIMHLDIGLIPLAGAGFYYLMKYNRTVSLIALLILASTAFYAAYELSSVSKPFIDEDEIMYISSLQNIKEDAYAMSIINFYTPWVAGYSGKETIDPGLLDFNKWSPAEWDRFWRTPDPVETAKMLSIYDKPIYIYIGKKMRLLNESKFSGECFKKVLDENGVQIYRFGCPEGTK